jgi:acetylornithine deacetylase/succinyl-diaminopimelate desuccinylase-like protein
MRVSAITSVLLTAVSLAPPSVAAEELRRNVESYVSRHQKQILSDLMAALEFPAVAADEVNIRRKAAYLSARLAATGMLSEILETDGNPLVYGYLSVPDATRTLLLYCHYDGQPVDPGRWQQADPFQPVMRDGKVSADSSVVDFDSQASFERDWRIYARSASDDTAPIIALLAALDALKSAGLRPSSNIKVVLDGEEEAGSPNLVPAIEHYRDKLAADMLLILDGPLHQSDRPTVVFGARGIMTIDLTVFGPRVPLHSGHYGNWAPNPAMQLAQLLSSMKDADGRVVIDGFYDDIEFTPDDQRVLDAVPDELEELQAMLGFSRPDKVGDTLQEAIQFPSLNIRGLQSAWIGDEARTIVPDRATAAIDIRLVRETEADDIYAKLSAHIEGQGFHIVATDPGDAVRARHGRIVKVVRHGSTAAYRTAVNDPLARQVVAAINAIWDGPIVRKRTSGGTVPIAPFIEVLGFPALGVPTVNFDNNQHSPNENVRLGHFFDSVVTFAAIFTM